jgi:hypothetical protein
MSNFEPDTESLPEMLYAGAERIARALRDLGNADACTPMGALEAHGLAIKDVGAQIADGLQAIAEALHEVASALDARK